ncbi:MAG: DUF655 domain-containing protein [Candidatus Diapherotrites archaeon]
MPNEEYSYVLDYLPKGKPNSYKAEPIAQILGIDFFTLLEVVPKTPLQVMNKIYVGKDERQNIEYIKKRITYKELTSTAVAELEKAVEKIVADDTKRFLDFFNNARSITIRRHQLELLPGLGKKHTKSILDAREKKPFESYADISKRVALVPNPKSILVKRILEEIEEEDMKYYLFARPPAKEFRR